MFLVRCSSFIKPVYIIAHIPLLLASKEGNQVFTIQMVRQWQVCSREHRGIEVKGTEHSIVGRTLGNHARPGNNPGGQCPPNLFAVLGAFPATIRKESMNRPQRHSAHYHWQTGSRYFRASYVRPDNPAVYQSDRQVQRSPPANDGLLHATYLSAYLQAEKSPRTILFWRVTVRRMNRQRRPIHHEGYSFFVIPINKLNQAVTIILGQPHFFAVFIQTHE